MSGYLRAPTDAWLPEATSGAWQYSSEGAWLGAPSMEVVTAASSAPDPRKDGGFVDETFPPDMSSISRHLEVGDDLSELSDSVIAPDCS